MRIALAAVCVVACATPSKPPAPIVHDPSSSAEAVALVRASTLAKLVRITPATVKMGLVRLMPSRTREFTDHVDRVFAEERFEREVGARIDATLSREELLDAHARFVMETDGAVAVVVRRATELTVGGAADALDQADVARVLSLADALQPEGEGRVLALVPVRAALRIATHEMAQDDPKRAELLALESAVPVFARADELRALALAWKDVDDDAVGEATVCFAEGVCGLAQRAVVKAYVDAGDALTREIEERESGH